MLQLMPMCYICTTNFRVVIMQEVGAGRGIAGIIKSLVIILCLPVYAFATLGQSTNSIAIDAAQLGIETADLQTFKTESKPAIESYSVYQMTTLSGIEIKQFVSNDKVFAIVWQGESTPNLTQLLGKYFHDYESATPKYKSQTLQSIEEQDFIAYFGNARGRYYGKALIPSLMPNGLNYTSIK